MGSDENLIYNKTYWKCMTKNLEREKKAILTHFLSRSDKLQAQAFIVEIE